jgi:mono/diheme cytochrome c family protein
MPDTQVQFRSRTVTSARAFGVGFLATMAILMLLPAAARADDRVDFDRDVRPIFASHCFKCHGPDKAKGGLRLNDRATVLGELESGERAVVPGKPEQSAVVTRVTSGDPDEQMPPKGERLNAQDVETLRRWIAQGAQWQVHWSYRPIVRREPPEIKQKSWARGPIDAFVLERLESQGLSPSPEAERHTLLRRLYYDLIGLTPEPVDAKAFLEDESPGAYEALVDKLLSSPQFGERWGRHWLDKARYADSDGYEKDSPRPDAYRFRDWVIDAVNQDLPFDRFTVEQIAGDLLPEATTEQQIATAFHRQTLTNKEGGVDAEQFRVEAVFDRAETTGAVWLGLTVGCARCHTHKYDAITHKEYYQLFAFFNNADEVDLPLAASPEAVARHEKQLEQHQAKVKELEAKLATAQQPAAQNEPTQDSDKVSQAELKEHLAELKKTAPKPPTTPAPVIAQRTNDPRPTRVLRRGDFLQPTDPVSPGVLATLHPLRPRRSDAPPDRLDLAHWLVDPANPLTPRVAVNDIWLHLFGQGLVRTAEDFGVRGEKPTHPELLDWLADEYRRLGWSRKAMIKQIVMSATYRQASRHRPEVAERDAENRLLHRQNRFRVEGEIVRDVTLAASGLLSRKIGGPSVFPPMPADVAALSYANNFKWKTSDGEDRYRRGMYTFFKRTAPHPDLMTFDCPDSNGAVVKRSVSNSPLQALTTLNNEAFHEAAQALAKRVQQSKTTSSDAERLGYAFRLCVLREPSAEERASFANLLDRSRTWYGDNPEAAKKLVGRYQPDGVAPFEAAAWIATARVLLNMDEFLTRE